MIDVAFKSKSANYSVVSYYYVTLRAGLKLAVYEMLPPKSLQRERVETFQSAVRLRSQSRSMLFICICFCSCKRSPSSENKIGSADFMVTGGRVVADVQQAFSYSSSTSRFQSLLDDDDAKKCCMTCSMYDSNNRSIHDNIETA